MVKGGGRRCAGNKGIKGIWRKREVALIERRGTSAAFYRHNRRRIPECLSIVHNNHRIILFECFCLFLRSFYSKQLAYRLAVAFSAPNPVLDLTNNSLNLCVDEGSLLSNVPKIAPTKPSGMLKMPGFSSGNHAFA